MLNAAIKKHAFWSISTKWRHRKKTHQRVNILTDKNGVEYPLRRKPGQKVYIQRPWTIKLSWISPEKRIGRISGAERTKYLKWYKKTYKTKFKNSKVQVHHIIPITRTGTSNNYGNLVLLYPKFHQPFSTWWNHY